MKKTKLTKEDKERICALTNRWVLEKLALQKAVERKVDRAKRRAWDFKASHPNGVYDSNSAYEREEHENYVRHCKIVDRHASAAASATAALRKAERLHGITVEWAHEEN